MIPARAEPPLEPEWVRRPAPDYDEALSWYVARVDRDEDGTLGCVELLSGPWSKRDAVREAMLTDGRVAVVEDWSQAKKDQDNALMDARRDDHE